MVQKKVKSKRETASHKYKVARKVREHNRKVRKEAKNNPHKKSNKLKKDPGIPNSYPYKEKLLHQIEDTKKKAEQEKEMQKLSRQALQQKNRNISSNDEEALSSLVNSANERGTLFDIENFSMSEAENNHDEHHHKASVLSEAAVSGSKDNSRKAYYKEFKKVIDIADVILEVLDARDPLGCRTKHIEEMILSNGPHKRIILILNKIDLVPKEVVQEWLKYLRDEFPAIAFKSNTQTQRRNLRRTPSNAGPSSDTLTTTSECIGADTLLSLLKNYCRNGGIKTSITIGVIGFPNVGKSSVINSLKRSRVCQVGPTPGVTKSSQEIHLDKNIKLLDCPGIVFSKSNGTAADEADVILRNCVKVELVNDPIAPVERIVERCKRQQLMLYYKVPAFLDVKDFLLHLAKIRGRIKKGGIPDQESTAKLVLNDWNSGRIPYYCLPPERKSEISSSIVSEWAQEFRLPEIVSVEADELGRLDLNHTSRSGFLPMKSGSIMDIDLSAGDEEEISNVDELVEMDEDGADNSDVEEDEEEENDAMEQE